MSVSVCHAQQDQFQYVLDAVASSATELSAFPYEQLDGCHRRLLIAMQDPRASALDRATLLRHVLRHETEIQGGVRQTCLLPADARLFSGVNWGELGVDAVPQQDASLLLTAQPWQPEWLPGTDVVPPAAAAFAETPRRVSRHLPGDPFLTELGYEYYLTPGQQMAVRACLAAPPGSVTVIDLPTGSGKSLCVHILSKIAFQGSHNQGLNVVVVPTVALALDQERVLREQGVEYDTAYVGGNDEDTAARRHGIRERIRSGEQAIVFTSPEGLLAGLKPSVYSAARGGRLQSLVIDEAHMVDQWGDDFRPAFQQIAGLRNALLREVAGGNLRTILLSATIAQSTLEALRSLFSGPGLFRVVAAAEIRPEPSYWVSRCASAPVKAARVREAIRHLPRPLILYALRRDDATTLYRNLRADGYRRIDLFTGSTGPVERRTIIDAWQQDRLDIVVATSAFGLGVDKRDVRSVVHACVPESLDRLYQEVGRGGRDGNASLSICIYSPRDEATAQGMAQKTVISCELGLKRWESLFHAHARPDPNGPYLLDVTAPPAYNIDMVNDENTKWNIRTLNIMARSGLIELDDLPLQTGEAETMVGNEPPESVPQENQLETKAVRLRRYDHLDAGRWHASVEPVRRSIMDSVNSQWGLLLNGLGSASCIADVLAESYTLDIETGQGPDARIAVARSCGGCAFCRTELRSAYTGSPVPARWPWPSDEDPAAELLALVGPNKLGAVALSHMLSEEAIGGLLLWLIGRGVGMVVATAALKMWLVERRHEICRRPVFWETSMDGAIRPPLQRWLPRAPRALLLLQQTDLNASEVWLRRALQDGAADVPTVLVAGPGLRDPSAPHRGLLDAFPGPILTQERLEGEQVI